MLIHLPFLHRNSPNKQSRAVVGAMVAFRSVKKRHDSESIQVLSSSTN